MYVKFIKHVTKVYSEVKGSRENGLRSEREDVPSPFHTTEGNTLGNTFHTGVFPVHGH